MHRLFTTIGTLLTKIESWLSLGGMIVSTGILTWLGQYWFALANHGWAAIVIVSLVCSSIVIGAISLSYIAVSYYRRPKVAEYTGQHVVTTSAYDVDMSMGESRVFQAPIGTRPQSRERIHHKTEKIILQTMANSDFPVIQNQIFENCDIVGPAFILPKNITLNGTNRFRGAPKIEDCLLEIPSDRRFVIGAIDVINCVFIDCAFVCVGIVVDRKLYDEFRRCSTTTQ